MKRQLWIGAVGGTSLVATFALGMAYAGAIMEPEVVTKTKTVTEQVEVVKEVTPEGCITALDLLSEAMTIASEQADLAGSSIMAAATGDVATMESNTAQVEELNRQIDELAVPLGPAVAECRGAA